MPETALEQKCGDCQFFRRFDTTAPGNSRIGNCLNRTIEVRFTQSDITMEEALRRAYLGYKIATMRATNTSCFTPKVQI